MSKQKKKIFFFLVFVVVVTCFYAYHQKGRVANTASRGDDLASTTVDALAGKRGVEDLELDVPDGFVTEGSLASTPLEALLDRVADRCQKLLVNLGGQRVVHEDVGSVVIRAECPDRTSCQKIPRVLGLEKLTQLVDKTQFKMMKEEQANEPASWENWLKHDRLQCLQQCPSRVAPRPSSVCSSCWESRQSI